MKGALTTAPETIWPDGNGLTPVDFRAFVLQQRAAMRGKSDVAFLQARKP